MSVESETRKVSLLSPMLDTVYVLAMGDHEERS